MPSVAVDTVVLLDFWDERAERRHERARNIDLYSFDSDFDAVDGITRLATGENPYV